MVAVTSLHNVRNPYIPPTLHVYVKNKMEVDSSVLCIYRFCWMELCILYVENMAQSSSVQHLHLVRDIFTKDLCVKICKRKSFLWGSTDWEWLPLSVTRDGIEMPTPPDWSLPVFTCPSSSPAFSSIWSINRLVGSLAWPEKIRKQCWF